MNLKQFKNLDALLKEEELPPFYFGVERKTNKDTFEIHNKNESKAKSNLGRKGNKYHL